MHLEPAMERLPCVVSRGQDDEEGRRRNDPEHGRAVGDRMQRIEQELEEQRQLAEKRQSELLEQLRREKKSRHKMALLTLFIVAVIAIMTGSGFTRKSEPLSVDGNVATPSWAILDDEHAQGTEDPSSIKVRSSSNGHVYHFVTHVLNWDDAQSYCRGRGLSLVEINGASEWGFLVNYIKSIPALDGKNFWIGARSTGYPYRWYWSCGGTPMTYSRWAASEPNRNSEFCVHMWNRHGYSWNNQRCEKPFRDMYFICETCTK